MSDVKRFGLVFRKDTDADVIERIHENGNMTEYIRALVRADISGTDRSRAENERLRRLCSAMFRRLYFLTDDLWCGMTMGAMTMQDVFEGYDELVELGVEV